MDPASGKGIPHRVGEITLPSIPSHNIGEVTRGVQINTGRGPEFDLEASSGYCTPLRRPVHQSTFPGGKKKDGSFRPAINLKPLNHFIATFHVKIEGSNMVKDILQPGDWMCSINLKDAYLSVSIMPVDRRFLRFILYGMARYMSLPVFPLGYAVHHEPLPSFSAR